MLLLLSVLAFPFQIIAEILMLAVSGPILIFSELFESINEMIGMF